MNRPAPLTPEEQQAILAEVGSAALAAAPEGWSEIRYTVAATARFSKFMMTIYFPNGDTLKMKAPMSMGTKMLELRTGMYEPGKGTWFTATYTIVRPARYSVDFDYDNEPEFSPDAFDFKPVPLTYLEDLDFFPRDEEHIPEWLRQQIDEARRPGSH